MALKRHLACFVATAVAAGLLVAPAFAAKALNWNETFKNADGKVLNFKVTSLTVTQTGWSAKVSFANLSKQTIQVGNEFGIAFFANSKTTNPINASALAQATTFAPKRPTALKPGATWAGVIGGSGQLETAKTSGYARILFGPFVGVPGQKAATSWITDHATSIPATSLTPSEPVA
ncbi:MAG TPA: hypothetical protein VG652_01360 [Gaiellaceae bacterium]|nr:hypothetical protein [Gaiellaceae bacterium]